MLQPNTARQIPTGSDGSVPLPTARQTSQSCALQALAAQNQLNNITLQELAASGDPIHTLRRHKPSAGDATTILKELALLEAANKQKKGSAAKGNLNTQIEADWPDLYVYRIGGSDPTYDSLTLAEFVAGYLSIMEEVTSVCPMNVRLLKHISYLRQLMEDCFLMEWQVVRTAHKQVLALSIGGSCGKIPRWSWTPSALH